MEQLSYAGRPPFIGKDGRGADSETDWMITMLTQLARDIETDVQKLVSQNCPMDKYQVGLWAQRRENLKTVAQYLQNR